MCYDISFTVQVKELSDYFPDLVFDDQIAIDFDKSIHIIGHAYGDHPIIFRNRDDMQLHCKLMEWGCIPFYIKDEAAFIKQRASMLNARSERILDDKSSYWHKIRNRRCLVPVSGFYEHRKVAGFKNKIPYYIEVDKQPLFFLPALYSVAELPNKETGELVKRWSFVILTRDANKLMQQIHNDGDHAGRMPLLLDFEWSKKWLNEELSDTEYREILNQQMPSEALQFKTVFTIRTTKERPDLQAKNEYYQWQGLEEKLLVE